MYNCSMSYENEYLLVGSEDLSREFNDVASFFSDFHKDVYGFRPRIMPLCACDYADEAELRDALVQVKAMLAAVQKDSVSVFEEEELRTKKCIDDFEAYVSKCIEVGATDRADAISWMCESYGVANEPSVEGWESLEYTTGVPFGYIQKSLQVAA